MSRRNEWIETDLDGLAKTLARRGNGYLLTELIRNALDETGVTRVDARLEPVGGRSWRLSVTDDAPGGFADLSHAYRLFAPSYKVADPSKAGRFNAGEKFVLAAARSARITSTTGSVVFDDGGRRRTGKHTERGTIVEAELTLTKAEAEEALGTVRRMLLPPGVEVTLNGDVLPAKVPIATLQVALPTEVADETGVLRRVTRTVAVRLHAADGGWLYELGVPVVPMGDEWHYDVQQKVPLNIERDNVPPSYRRALRTAVLNLMHDRLPKQAATEAWVRDALASPDVKPEAVTTVMGLRFGEKRVAFDPSDPEANKLAVVAGYTVVTGGALTRAEWDNVRAASAIRPAGQVTPSPKPFSKDGTPLKLRTELTPEMQSWAAFAADAYGAAIQRPGAELYVRFAQDRGWPFTACFGSGELTVNVARLGEQWFDPQGTTRWLELLIHEFGHYYASDHLSDAYHRALCTVGARLAVWLSAAARK
jgi:hypothetical protein